jgi:hypothetical protein
VLPISKAAAAKINCNLIFVDIVGIYVGGVCLSVLPMHCTYTECIEKVLVIQVDNAVCACGVNFFARYHARSLMRCNRRLNEKLMLRKEKKGRG